MAMYSLAEVLGKTLGEIGEIPYDEFIGWIAYFKLKDTENGKRK